jgi:hypothetical protein
MLTSLRVLWDILSRILQGVVSPLLLAAVGAAAIAALLWLANSSRREIVTVAQLWLFTGFLGSFTYSALTFLVPSLESLWVLFIISLGTGPLLGSMIPHSPKSKRFRWWVPYAVWIYVWATTLIGWRYGGWGLVYITLPALTITGAVFFLIAGFLLPFPTLDLYRGDRDVSDAPSIPTFAWELKDLYDLLNYTENREARKELVERRRKALRCLLTYALGTQYPYHVVIDEKIKERIKGDRTWLPWDEKLVKRLDGDAFGSFLAGPGIILTGCDHAVALSTGLTFKGAKGPGVVFTEMSDHVCQVIDLRVQLRAFPVEARTKDGIGISVFTFTPFQIGTSRDKENPKKPHLGEGFPYHVPDVFKAIQAQQVEHEDPSQVPKDLKRIEWYDLPQLIGERAVREKITCCEFDDLYAPFELRTEAGQRDPRSRIGDALREALEAELPDCGLQRIGSGISNLEPVDSRVIRERIESWKANWRRKIMLQQATGQSKRLRLVERARAQAQVDLILKIGQQIEEFRSAEGTVPMDAIAAFFIETLEGLTGGQAPRQFLPTDTDTVIQRAYGAVAESQGDRPESQREVQ